MVQIDRETWLCCLKKTYQGRSRDFSKVYRHGQEGRFQTSCAAGFSSSSGWTIWGFFFFFEHSLLGHPPPAPARIGITVSQKVSKRAVVRNRLKRQVRAALRGLLPQLERARGL